MTLRPTGRDGDIEAFVVDRYLESLLAREPRDLTDIPFSAEVLYFSRGVSPEVIAYDVIEQDPESASLTVQRITVSEEYGELVLTPTPTPLTGATGGTVPTGGTAATTSPS